jgi:hypothetical protein
MQIDSTLLGVRNDTGLVARETEVAAENAELTTDGERRCEQAQPPYRPTRDCQTNHHSGLKVPSIA